ncbi:GAF domain-containing protein [Alteribacillus persepolensis]|uniref:GAF domain-containing protein n=1 Tax=Alteribacillus persepolensis TaxID=568899 RepID=A0A1G8IKH7_9BACI|nr:GAF domain-containing protein [Alteribacillus persepolensis]SDI19414.1 GAF domain-containing protein [Alteribacillus persepolensis]
MEEINNFLSNFPPFLKYILLTLLIVLLIVIIIRVATGKSNVSFWGFKMENNREVEKIQTQFDELNEHSQLKSQVLKLLNQSIITYSVWENLQGKEFEKNVQRFYNFFLPGIISLITKQRDNSHRIAVFHDAGGYLKVLHGFGYYPNGGEELKLGFRESKAGECFTKGETYYNPDLSQDPSFNRNIESSKEYNSLLCIPIVFNEQSLGVLNIDGVKKNSFNKDDIDYLTFFANSLAPLLNKELKYNEILSQVEVYYEEKEKSS